MLSLVYALVAHPLAFLVIIVIVTLVFLRKGRFAEAVGSTVFFSNKSLPFFDYVGIQNISLAQVFLVLWVLWRLSAVIFGRAGYFPGRLSTISILVWAAVVALWISVSGFMSSFQTIDQTLYALKFFALGFVGLVSGVLSGAEVMRTFGRSFLVSAATVVLIWVGMTVVHIWFPGIFFQEHSFFGMFPVGSQGYAASYLLVALLTGLFLYDRQEKDLTESYFVFITGSLVFGIYLSGSRVAALATLIALILLLAASARNSRLVLPLIKGFGAGVLMIGLWFVMTTSGRLPEGLAGRPLFTSSETSLATPNGLLDNERFGFWLLYLEAFLREPIFGVGIIDNSLPVSPHSLPIEILTGLGLVGLLVAMALPLWTVVRFFKAEKTRSALHLGSIGLVVALLLVAPQEVLAMPFPIFWFYWGLLISNYGLGGSRFAGGAFELGRTHECQIKQLAKRNVGFVRFV